MESGIFKDLRLSIIRPTYDEADNIVPLIDETLRYIHEKLNYDFLEIIVVDDDSPDRTWELVQNHKDKNVKVIRRLENRGLCNSINEGIIKAQGDIIVWMDCDFSHPPEYIPQMVECVALGWDIAVNSRYVAGGEDVREGKGTLIQKCLSWLLNMIMWGILGQSFRDYTSGFIAVRKNVVDDLKLCGDYGEYFINFIYRAIKNKYRVLELPYINKKRRFGISKTGNNIIDYIGRGNKYLLMIWRIKMNKR